MAYDGLASQFLLFPLTLWCTEKPILDLHDVCYSIRRRYYEMQEQYYLDRIKYDSIGSQIFTKVNRDKDSISTT